jgi:hypothetical protein
MFFQKQGSLKSNRSRFLFRTLTGVLLFCFTAPSLRAETATYDFSAETDYVTGGSTTIQDGAAMLPATSLDRIDDDSESSGFGGGTDHGTSWDDDNDVLTADTNLTAASDVALPDNSDSSWADMSANILLLHFDEASGATGFSDASNEDADASCTGDLCPVSGIEGLFDSALRFGATDASTAQTDYLEIPYVINPNGQVLSVEAWIKPADIRNFTEQVILTQRQNGASDCDGDGTALWLYLDHNDEPDRIAAGEAYVCSLMGMGENCTSGSVSETQWAHVVLVKEYNSFKIYLNGEEDLSASWGGTVCPSSNTNGLYVGADPENTTGEGEFAFNGLMDDVAVYERALSADEVRSHYARPHFDSRIIDAGTTLAAWTEISWQPRRPAQKSLPDGGLSESAYAAGNADMTGNVLLAHFDGDATAALEDDSPAGNALSCTACPAVTSGGKFAQAFEFDGADDYVVTSAATTEVNPAEDDFTAEAWIRPEDMDGTTRNVFSQGSGTVSGGSGRSWLYISSSKQLCSTLGNVTTCTTAYPIKKRRWHHVAVRKSAAEGNLCIYVDGDAATRVCTTSSMEPANGPIYIGSNKDGSGIFYGRIDEASVYARALSDTEILDRYLRGAVRIGFQIRSCDDADCDGEEFAGPDGTASTYYSELSNDGTDLPAVTLSGVADNRYLQYRAVLASDDTDYPAGLSNVAIGGSPDAAYDASGASYVRNASGSAYANLSGFTATAAAGSAGSFCFQLSPDGANWYYHNGSAWITGSDESQCNAATDLNGHVGTFSSEVGTGSLFFKAFLVSDGSQAVLLDQVGIDFTTTSVPSEEADADGDGTPDATDDDDDNDGITDALDDDDDGDGTADADESPNADGDGTPDATDDDDDNDGITDALDDDDDGDGTADANESPDADGDGTPDATDDDDDNDGVSDALDDDDDGDGTADSDETAATSSTGGSGSTPTISNPNPAEESGGGGGCSLNWR